MTIKRADAAAIQIKGNGRKKATMIGADTNAIQIKGLQIVERGDNQESGYRGYTNEGRAKGGNGRQ